MEDKVSTLDNKLDPVSVIDKIPPPSKDMIPSSQPVQQHQMQSNVQEQMMIQMMTELTRQNSVMVTELTRQNSEINRLVQVLEKRDNDESSFRTQWKSGHICGRFVAIKCFSGKIGFLDRIVYIFKVLYDIFTLNFFLKNASRHLSAHDSVDELYDRLFTQWANVSVVSALCMTIGYASFIVQFNNKDDVSLGGVELGLITSIIYFSCILLFFGCIATCIILSLGLMTLPRDAAITFATEATGFIQMPEYCLGSGMCLLLIATVFTGWMTQGTAFLFYGIGLLIGICCLWFILMFVFIMVLDRSGGLWEQAKLIEEEDVNTATLAGPVLFKQQSNAQHSS
jgi:hypothetical protein